MELDYNKLYKAYIKSRSQKGVTATDVAKKFGITRNGLYDIVRKIDNGNREKSSRCAEKARLECLWKHTYKARSEALPFRRTCEVVDALKEIIVEMHKDGFTPSDIARLIKRDRSTVIHHLK